VWARNSSADFSTDMGSSAQIIGSDLNVFRREKMSSDDINYRAIIDNKIVSTLIVIPKTKDVLE
jgi:hypothetical protein